LSDAPPHRTQKLARLVLNCLLFGLKTADLGSYSGFLFADGDHHPSKPLKKRLK
jgi:hypothetical protein